MEKTRYGTVSQLPIASGLAIANIFVPFPSGPAPSPPPSAPLASTHSPSPQPPLPECFVCLSHPKPIYQCEAG